MKDLIQSLQEADQVFLPDRYPKQFINAYQNITGREVPAISGRKAEVLSDGVVFRRIRGRDIPKAVCWSTFKNPTMRVVGLSSSEWVLNFEIEFGGSKLACKEIVNEPLGAVALLTRPEGIKEGPIPVVTSYEFLTPKLGAQNGLLLMPEIIVSGSADNIAKDLNMCAVDLTATGESAVENGFDVTRLLEVFVTAIRASSLEEIGAQRAYQLINTTTC